MGKQWKGQVFVANVTAEDLRRRVEVQREHDSDDAISLNVYFVVKGIRDPVKQAAMKAFTLVRSASRAAWDEIFDRF